MEGIVSELGEGPAMVVRGGLCFVPRVRIFKNVFANAIVEALAKHPNGTYLRQLERETGMSDSLIRRILAMLVQNDQAETYARGKSWKGFKLKLRIRDQALRQIAGTTEETAPTMTGADV